MRDVGQGREPCEARSSGRLSSAGFISQWSTLCPLTSQSIWTCYTRYGEREEAPSAVLIRPDGHVARVGDGTDHGLRDALTTWFEPPTAP
ncbi:MAG TPA: hypothetical protein VE093_42380 [Polyangiaceae bacterium]|nr:hypothetical protein [Polyangiaceae bacterium]